jgi:glycosyltransferase involved in cell wall biosynthesis
MNISSKNVKKEVAIVMPAYNAAKYLPKSVESVLNQTYLDFELIIVDDGSSDETKKVLEPYRNRISYIYQSNGGISKARNTGIQSTACDYIALMDADDIWFPEKLERQMEFFKEYPELALVFCDLEFFDEHRTGYSTFWKDTGYYDEMMSEYRKIRNPFAKLMRKNFILSSAAVVKRECFSRAGLFDETVRCPGAEDKEMWLRIAVHYDMGCVPRSLVRRRMHPYSTRALESIFLSIIEVVNKMENLYPERIKREKINTRVIKGQRYYFLGRVYLDDNNLSHAREAFVSSLRHAFSVKALLFLILTLGGGRWINILRRYKKRYGAFRIADFADRWVKW